MEREIAVSFKKVNKEYKLYKNDKARFLGLFSKKIPYKVNRASENLSFDIYKGDAIAFLGRNGAGKSTILKMITGVTYPTSGTIEVNGKVSALLELSAGFDLEATGKENIRLKCQLMGMSREEIAEVEPAIIEFADIGEYIDQPLRSYSSGMKARLGFAINANSNPDILIVDEALSVGDSVFRIKCRDKISEIMAKDDVTLLFVTHTIAVAREFCSKGIVLRKGKKVFEGDIDDAITYYENSSSIK